MSWILLTFITAVFFGVYSFIKVSSGHINQIAGAYLASSSRIGWRDKLAILKFTNSPIEISNKGVFYAILAGLFIGLAEIATFLCSQKSPFL